MNQLMTVSLLQAALPKNLQGMATEEFADKINNMIYAPETLEEIRQNFLTYSKVLQDGRFKTEDYLAAVTYVTHKLMGYSNKEAYVRTFPDRYASLVARGSTDKDISAYVSAYSKNKLVGLILEQTMIPAHVLYQDAFHAAINTQIRLMTSSTSDKVQSDAANSILTHLKAPEIKKVQMEVGLSESDGLAELRGMMRELALSQRAAIEQRHVTPGAVAASKLTLTEAEKAGAIDG